ncbi:MAG: LacI family DNA-binding transcriptional regulator [Thermomicrobiales bacterium]|jgi:LacI family transcriptional regulator|nr:LacI family DNA-binding transcriptional regulator [Thermomicrobiales bacterium]
MSTIKDIARHAGVSAATVSNVINETRYVSPELRDRVMAAVSELEYRPNAVAKSLRKKRTSTIGLIAPDNSNPFFAEVAKGVEDAGFRAGVSVILCNSDSSFDRECSYLQLLSDKQVDGIIFIATTPEIDHLTRLIDPRLPMVVFYRQSDRPMTDSLVVDNFGGGYLATQHLIELGHRHIACVAPASTNSPSSLRVSGYRQAMQDAGLAVEDDLLFRGDNRFSGGRDGASHLLAGRRRFTAMFAGNDVMAVGAIREFRDQGIDVPRDVSVAGFDGIALGEVTIPALTTIVQPRYDAGHRAFGLLYQRIEEGYDGPPRHESLGIELVVRESTMPLAQSQKEAK